MVYVVHISGFNDEDAALTAQENLSREGFGNVANSALDFIALP